MGLSKQDKVNEIIKCGKDPVYFINTYVKIQHPVRGRIPFETYDFQDDVVRDIANNRFNIVLKSRQLGLSTIASAYAVWYAIFHKDKNILVIATKLETAINFVKKVKIAIQGLPPWLLLPKFTENKTEVNFTNGSQIKAVPTSDDAGRSEALSLLIVDEAAFIKNFEEIWTGLYPTISCLVAGTKVLTSNGFRKIEDFCRNRYDGEYFELSGTIWGKNGFEDLSHGYVSPASETRKFTTKSGRVIECTLNHPLWSLGFDSVGMVKSKDLQIGDLLRVEYGMNVYGSDRSLTNDDAYLLGLYTAEGWIPQQNKDIDAKRYSVYVSNTEPDIQEFLLSRGFKFTSGKLARFSRKEVEWFEKCGVDPKQKCFSKRVPDVVWNSPKEIQINYLRGYFDGDGCATGGASAVSTSRELLEDIQLLLLNMGFLPRISSLEYDPEKAGVNHRVMPSGQVLRSVRKSYSISIPRSQLEQFQSTIGFRCKRKVATLKKVCQKYKSAQNKSSRLFELHARFSVIDKAIRDVVRNDPKLNFSKLRHEHGFRYEKRPTSKKAQQFVELMNRLKIEVPDNLKEMCGNFYYDPIVKIEQGFAKTYDFTVPDTHTFLQNGILGSNTGGRAFILSTPNGVGGTYHKLWVDAESGQNSFNTIKLPWWVHPEHDDAWFQEESKNFSKRKVAQEFLCDFLSSGDTYLQADVIEWLKENTRDPIEKAGFDRNVWVWNKPEPETKYVISADIARGDAADFSAFHIINADTSEVDVEYMGKAPPEVMGKLIDEWGRKYNTALAIPENNTFGYTTCIYLRDTANYPKLYHEKNSDDPFKVVLADELRQYSKPPGFSTQYKSRVNILTKLEELIRNKLFHVYSVRFVQQLQTFVWENSKPQALKGCNDDLILSLAIGAYIVGGAYKLGSSQEAHAVAMIKAMSIDRRDQSILPGDDVKPLTNPQITGMTPSNIYKPRDPSQVKHVKSNDTSDFSWLLK